MSSSECIAGWCADAEWGEVACAAEVLGRKWHRRIVAALLADGPLRFSTLRDRLDGVASRTSRTRSTTWARRGWSSAGPTTPLPGV